MVFLRFRSPLLSFCLSVLRVFLGTGSRTGRGDVCLCRCALSCMSDPFGRQSVHVERAVPFRTDLLRLIPNPKDSLSFFSLFLFSRCLFSLFFPQSCGRGAKKNGPFVHRFLCPLSRGLGRRGPCPTEPRGFWPARGQWRGGRPTTRERPWFFCLAQMVKSREKKKSAAPFCQSLSSSRP